jgi:hypothetical protein
LRTITRRGGVGQGDKTIKVVVNYQMRHPKYGKYLKRRTVLHAHDEKNEAKEGDTWNRRVPAAEQDQASSAAADRAAGARAGGAGVGRGSDDGQGAGSKIRGSCEVGLRGARKRMFFESTQDFRTPD